MDVAVPSPYRGGRSQLTICLIVKAEAVKVATIQGMFPFIQNGKLNFLIQCPIPNINEIAERIRGVKA
jgi:hypothetical protein